MAMLWAAGFIWLALDVAGSSKPPNASANQSASQGSTATDQDVQAAANALGL